MSAAGAIIGALRRHDPDTEATVVDSYTFAASVVSRVVSEGYLGMVKTIPQMYRFLYNRAERATEVGPFRTWVHQFTAGNLRGLMGELRPDVVVCTHAFPSGAMAEYKRMFEDAPAVVGVVTDFAVHSFWIHDNVEGYAVATEEMRSTLVARGIRPERIVVSGIPIRESFSAVPHDRAALRESLGLPRDKRIVLLMGGGLGIGPLSTIMHALSDCMLDICVVAIVGRSSRSEERVRQAAREVKYPVRVFGFVDNVDEYMHAADVLITKPGGLTSAEALAAAVPLVLFKPLPGQEERNTRYLVERGAAVRVKGIHALNARMTELLETPGRISAMRSVMRTLSKPHAATDVATLMRRLAKTRAGEAIA